MELEGLKRGLRHITELNVVHVHDLVTDRHVMIKSYMKTERPNMNHYFDVWHVAKGNQILNFVSLIKKIINLILVISQLIQFIFRNIKKT